MSKAPKEKKAKKKRGFLGNLMRFFLFFIFFLVLASGLGYWKKEWVTGQAFKVYSQLIAKTLTSSDYYDLESDQEYQTELVGETEGKEQLKESIREKRHNEMRSSFDEVRAMYEAHPKNDWYPFFTEFFASLRSVLSDRKVSEKELQDFREEFKAKAYELTSEAEDSDEKDSTSDSPSEKPADILPASSDDDQSVFEEE